MQSKKVTEKRNAQQRKRRAESPKLRAEAADYGRQYRARPEYREQKRSYYPADYAKHGEKIRAQKRNAGRRRNKTPIPAHPMPALCECCGGPPNGCSKELVPDHCHAVGAARGWLCSKCNLLLGLLGDDLVPLKQRYEQLRRYLLKYSHIAWMEGL